MREEISFRVYHRLRTYSAPGKKLVQVQVRQLAISGSSDRATVTHAASTTPRKSLTRSRSVKFLQMALRAETTPQVATQTGK